MLGTSVARWPMRRMSTQALVIHRGHLRRTVGRGEVCRRTPGRRPAPASCHGCHRVRGHRRALVDYRGRDICCSSRHPARRSMDGPRYPRPGPQRTARRCRAAECVRQGIRVRAGDGQPWRGRWPAACARARRPRRHSLGYHPVDPFGARPSDCSPPCSPPAISSHRRWPGCCGPSSRHRPPLPISLSGWRRRRSPSPSRGPHGPDGCRPGMGDTTQAA